MDSTLVVEVSNADLDELGTWKQRAGRALNHAKTVPSGQARTVAVSDRERAFESCYTLGTDCS
jgi:hypothetical protein